MSWRLLGFSAMRPVSGPIGGAWPALRRSLALRAPADCGGAPNVGETGQSGNGGRRLNAVKNGRPPPFVLSEVEGRAASAAPGAGTSTSSVRTGETVRNRMDAYS